MIVKERIHRDQLEMFSIEEFVPADHLLRKIDSAVDFIHIYTLSTDIKKHRNFPFGQNFRCDIVYI